MLKIPNCGRKLVLGICLFITQSTRVELDNNKVYTARKETYCRRRSSAFMCIFFPLYRSINSSNLCEIELGISDEAKPPNY
jgi:hypothetical protein